MPKRNIIFTQALVGSVVEKVITQDSPIGITDVNSFKIIPGFYAATLHAVQAPIEHKTVDGTPVLSNFFCSIKCYVKLVL